MADKSSVDARVGSCISTSTEASSQTRATTQRRLLDHDNMLQRRLALLGTTSNNNNYTYLQPSQNDRPVSTSFHNQQHFQDRVLQHCFPVPQNQAGSSSGSITTHSSGLASAAAAQQPPQSHHHNVHHPHNHEESIRQALADFDRRMREIAGTHHDNSNSTNTSGGSI